jgi:apolipoprotein N-acyltransferase
MLAPIEPASMENHDSRRRAADCARVVALVSIGCGCILASLPPCDLWIFGIVAWVPLATIATSFPPRQAALAGWLHGAVAQFLVLLSMPRALHETAHLQWFWALLLAIAVAGFEGGRFGVIAFVSARATRNDWPNLLPFPIALAATEVVYPMLFPWSTALFLQQAPILLQLAEVGGPIAISLSIGFVSASLARASRERKRSWVFLRYCVAFPAAVLLSVVAYGAMRMRAVEDETLSHEPTTLALVQANIGPSDADPLSTLRTLTLDLLRDQRPDLVVWPETALSTPVADEDLGAFFSREVLRSVSRGGSVRIGVRLLTGAVIERRQEESAAHVRRGHAAELEARRFNSVVLASPDGRILGEYDKRDLVPLGEYLPLEQELPWLRKLLPAAGAFSVGEPRGPLLLGDKRVLVLLCYEDILPDRVRADVDRTDPDLIVDLSNDAWFPASRVPALHLALAKLRAIEHRRYLVHLTNTGVSAAVDPSGRIVDELPPERAVARIVQVRYAHPKTVYETVGIAPGLGVVALALFLAVKKRSALWGLGRKAARS